MTLQSLEDINYSSEFFLRKPPAAYRYFIFIISGLFIAAVVWASFFEMDIAVKADAILTQSVNISVGKIGRTGVIDGVYFTPPSRKAAFFSALKVHRFNLIKPSQRMPYNAKNKNLQHCFCTKKQSSPIPIRYRGRNLLPMQKQRSILLKKKKPASSMNRQKMFFYGKKPCRNRCVPNKC